MTHGMKPQRMPARASTDLPSQLVTDQRVPSVSVWRLLTTKQAAAYLSYSPWQLRRFVQNGQLSVVIATEGGRWRFDIADLEAFVERNKQRGPR
jgi:excisionase family DNA binding protein